MIVLISIYKNDNASHLRLSIDSILHQTYSDFRILIGVDGYVDALLAETLKSYEQDNRIKVFWFKENRGLTAVLNELLEEGKKLNPSYIARMDADDISRPNRFEKQVRYLEEHPDLDVLGGAIEEMDYDGKLNGKVIHYPLNHQQCFDFFATRNPLAHPAVIVQGLPFLIE